MDISIETITKIESQLSDKNSRKKEIINDIISDIKRNLSIIDIKLESLDYQTEKEIIINKIVCYMEYYQTRLKKQIEKFEYYNSNK